MFSKTRSTQRELSTMFVLILLLLWMKQVCAQTPVIGVDPSRLDFAPVVGQSITKTLTVSNTGTSALTVSALRSTNNTVFSVIDTAVPFTVAPNATPVTVPMLFTPPTDGPHLGQLRITSDDPNREPVSITLQG